ncbi:MAG: tetratricopeptide repeat protein [Bacteroidales bacterium]|nr:tetratricopeptide repeat protein [Bacteroidales bacterium]MCF6341381.1 tetratricopeptide repeat protein [Bacteroidales bacterium]
MMKQTLIAILFLTMVSACSSGEPKMSSESQTVKEKEPVQLKDTVEQETAKPDMADTQPQTSGNKLVRMQAQPKDKGPDDAQKLNKRRAQTAIRTGVQHYKNGEMEQAKDAFKRVLEYSPEDSKASHYLGKIYYGFGEKDIALAYYEDAVRFNPDDSASMVGAGLILFEKNDFNGAIEYYNKAIKTAPGYALAYYDRGTLLGFQKNYGGALVDMNRAIELDPENSKYYMNRGLANYYLKRLEDACKDWKKSAAMGNAEAKKAVRLYCQGK